MEKIKISIVRYANSFPFVWGLKEGLIEEEASIETDHPAVCAAKLIEGKADIGLIPVAALPQMKYYEIISDFCIGAKKKVKTVMLLSNNDIDDVQNIYLDYRSISSVALARVLAKFMWKKQFIWLDTSEKFDFKNIPENHGLVLIGDQCFSYMPYFKFSLDLAEEWKKFTGYSFVFACWVANRKIDNDFLDSFNAALKSGLDNIDKVVEEYSGTSVMKGKTLKKYLTCNIDYYLDEDKKKGMKHFLDMINRI